MKDNWSSFDRTYWRPCDYPFQHLVVSNASCWVFRFSSGSDTSRTAEIFDHLLNYRFADFNVTLIYHSDYSLPRGLTILAL